MLLFKDQNDFEISFRIKLKRADKILDNQVVFLGSDQFDPKFRPEKIGFDFVHVHISDIDLVLLHLKLRISWSWFELLALFPFPPPPHTSINFTV